MSDAAADFEFVDDVTSDLSFVARGDTLPAVFAAAAAALLDATVEEWETVGEVETRHLELAEPDLELLLRPREVRVEAERPQATVVVAPPPDAPGP